MSHELSESVLITSAIREYQNNLANEQPQIREKRLQMGKTMYEIMRDLLFDQADQLKQNWAADRYVCLTTTIRIKNMPGHRIDVAFGRHAKKIFYPRFPAKNDLIFEYAVSKENGQELNHETFIISPNGIVWESDVLHRKHFTKKLCTDITQLELFSDIILDADSQLREPTGYNLPVRQT